MLKMNIKPQIVFQIFKSKKYYNLICGEHSVYNLRSRFFPDLQLSQNHTAHYGASFKVQKVMLPSLKCQIFLFLVYTAKYPHAKK